MRLKKIDLSGFRAFAATTSIDLDADCVIISGPNGQGKTSLLDGIFWALTGQIARLGPDAALVSLYSETGAAAATLTLGTEQGDLVVSRRFDGANTTLAATLGSAAIEIADLRRRFGKIVTSPDNENADESALVATMARSLYLQQDAIRDFINADSDDTRFRIVAELCGLGRVSDLQAALQQERRNWTHSTSQVEAQLSAKRSRLGELRDRAARLPSGEDTLDKLTATWAGWWQQLREVVPSFTEPVPEVSAVTADASLDRAVRLLESAKLESQRTIDSLDALLADLSGMQTLKSADLTPLRKQLEIAESEEAASRDAFNAVEAANLAAQHELLLARSVSQDLRALSELALRHLGEHCPVCEQSIDIPVVAAKLKAFLTQTPESDSTIRDLSPAISDLNNRQQRTLLASEALRAAEAALSRYEQQRLDLQRRLQSLGMAEDELLSESVRSMRDAALDRVSKINTARLQADALSLAKAKATELAQRAEVSRQLLLVDQEAVALERTLTGRQRAGRIATSISEAMREAALQIVDTELKRIEPLLQRIWSGIDPHPSLRAVQLISRLSYGKGRLTMRIRDDAGSVSTESPETVLSSSQQNALAVALFLTLNIGAQSLALPSIVLDDPFQSMDDINLLGLIDLLRRLSGRRQLIVTTHEHRFAQLLARKLRPIQEQHSTKLIELDSWDRTAPLVRQLEVSPDLTPFRFVA